MNEGAVKGVVDGLELPVCLLVVGLRERACLQLGALMGICSPMVGAHLLCQREIPLPPKDPI